MFYAAKKAKLWCRFYIMSASTIKYSIKREQIPRNTRFVSAKVKIVSVMLVQGKGGGG